ncbi:MAG: glycosyltransferase family 4 protein [Armatimonadota bacterium]
MSELRHMRLGLLYLDRGEGTDHFAYSHASVLARETELICYLSARNTLLDRFRDLPCEVKTFEWARGWRRLVVATLARKDPTGVSREVNRDAPDLVLNTHASWWSPVVERRFRPGITIAEIIHDVVPHPGLSGIVHAVYRRLVPSAADILIAISQYGYDELIRRFPGKMHIASRHGIFLPEGRIETAAVARRRHNMFFFGRIDRYKGIEFLVEAYSIAARSDSAIKLDIMGSGPIPSQVKRRINELGIGLANRYLQDEEVKEAVATHGVLILPYTSATQSGVAAIALGNGLPCIATNVGALPEQVVHNRNGIIVPPRNPEALAEAMCKIAADENLARSMAEEAVRIGREEYSWEVISRRLLSDLQTCIASLSRTRGAGRESV